MSEGFNPYEQQGQQVPAHTNHSGSYQSGSNESGGGYKNGGGNGYGNRSNSGGYSGGGGNRSGHCRQIFFLIGYVYFSTT